MIFLLFSEPRYLLRHEFTFFATFLGVFCSTYILFLLYVLHLQIFNWLSHSPTDIESYIRPGCIILTIYLRLEKSTWDEVCVRTDARYVELLTLVSWTAFSDS
jgi:hypothetical protein